ncbi:tetratricopeptide repeat protein [Roseivirga misakiensis]|uniref:Uncharacterized protein n=1 Tax=Roseivirga misakiensis TaxID=1563681 RepID=A0A1E5T104_9BACT|nr:tetratricopeptide repeat protein [Roseivirga misakiensis]OEK05063.1 hypothetical protein BFP71_16730 [Roseivirga misakiensis]
MLLKRNLKEVEERKLLAKKDFFFIKNRWIGLIVYPFFMLFILLTANGQALKDPRLNALLGFEFDSPPLATNDIQEPLDLYYQNLSDILKAILLENDERYEQLEKQKEVRLSQLEQFKSEDNPWYGFVKAEIKLQWAFVNFKFGHDWDAFWGLRSASKAINKQNRDFPSFAPNKRTLGVLNIIFGNVPSKNQWLMKLFGLKGNVLEGIDQLENIGEAYEDISLEAKLILSMVQVYLLEDYEQADQQFSDLLTDYNLPLVQYIGALVQLKAHDAAKARELLVNSPVQFPFHDYLLAETYFQAQVYDTAISLYEKFLNEFKGNSYVKDAYLKIGMSYGLSDDLDKYESYLQLARANGNTQSEIDKNANKLIQDLPNQRPLALRIRYAIDGGFYDLAKQLIVAHEATALSRYEQLELTYRKARVNHLSGNSEEALQLYRSVIENADLISETYYGPNSFLQAGYLLRDSGNKEEALMYFEEVLKLKKHPYKASLDVKAKIAIERLDR